MLDLDWIVSTASALLMVVLSGVGAYAALLLMTRLTGLRSFSKMSGFDFAVTVALGTVMASTLLAEDPPLVQGVTALAVLFGLQAVVSRLRRGVPGVAAAVDNAPLLVMAGTEVLADHLGRAQMTEADLRYKLRMAGVTHPSQVLAVVVETTGDVSVLKRGGDVDYGLFEGVRGADRLPRAV